MRKRATKQRQSEQRPPGAKLVLYIEDDEENREVAKKCLGEKYALLLAAGDREACELIRVHAGAIGIFLVDIELKDSRLNGLQLIECLRGHPPGSVELPDYARELPTTTAPILVVTAYGEAFPLGRVQAAGADDLIQKPVDFHALERAITSAILKDVTAR